MNILNVNNLKKTIRYLKRNGIHHTFYAAKERIEEEYWHKYRYCEPGFTKLENQRLLSETFPYCFSIIVPTYETKEEFLRDMLDSVIKQTYSKWELIIVDAGKSRLVEAVVKHYQEKDDRIRYIRLEKNGGISENTNAGIKQASGDFIGLLDHDDVLTPDALFMMADRIQREDQLKKPHVMLYSDEDKMGRKGHLTQPNRKYDFNYDLLLSNNYICHFVVLEAKVLKEIKLDKEFDGAQDYHLVLRVVDRLLKEGVPAHRLNEYILHVPSVLYHWRCHKDSTAENTASKSYAYAAGERAAALFGSWRGWENGRYQVEPCRHLGFHQITYFPDIMTVRPEVGIIGGRILDKKNRIMAGIYDEKGKPLYRGLHKEYSGGSTHRASLTQNCLAVDIRCMRMRPELQSVFETVTGIPYRERGEQHLADVSSLVCDECEYRDLSLALGLEAKKRGYLVVWLPWMTIRSEELLKN